MIKQYKGIDLQKNKDVSNYITTYHILDRDNYLDYLERDKALQKIVKQHQAKNKIKVAIYNLIPFIILFMAIWWKTK